MVGIDAFGSEFHFSATVQGRHDDEQRNESGFCPLNNVSLPRFRHYAKSDAENDENAEAQRRVDENPKMQNPGQARKTPIRNFLFLTFL
jgi:hypothetical protein